jgi:hypothetical protein
VNLLGFLGVYGKTKDTPEAWQDQQRMKEWDDMHLEKTDKLSPASYALTREEKEIFFQCLSSIKFPSGFSLNIKGIINMVEKKLQNLKSHAITSDCTEGASTKKCSSTHCEDMCIPQCNFSKGNRSWTSMEVTEWCGPISCYFWVCIPTILLQYYVLGFIAEKNSYKPFP